MAGYVKLFASIVDSTLWSESSDIRIVWITMLAMADKNGKVDASIPGLANRAQVSIETVEEALGKFMSPDKYSRTKDREGRRIEEVRGGWQILNYTYYRGQLTADKRREETRIRQTKWRERQRALYNRNNAQADPTADPTATADPNSLRSFSDIASPSLRSSEAISIPDTVMTQEDLIPSLATTVLTTDGLKYLPKKDKVKKTKRKPNEIKKTRIAKGTPTWEAYSKAYKKRYGVEPVRNAKTNSLCVQLVDRLSANDAPLVASHYLLSSNGFYVSSGHSLAILVRDAEKIRTEWATGRQSSQAQAHEADRRQTTRSAVEELCAEYEREERELNGKL